MATETIYLEKCANCNSKNLTLEFGTSGQLVCQECGMIGYTQQYSTQDIDELATMLQNVTTTEQQNMEEELPKVIQEMLLEYEMEEAMKEAMEEAEKTEEQRLEERLREMQI